MNALHTTTSFSKLLIIPPNLRLGPLNSVSLSFPTGIAYELLSSPVHSTWLANRIPLHLIVPDLSGKDKDMLLLSVQFAATSHHFSLLTSK
jgi:hypothetical protein